MFFCLAASSGCNQDLEPLPAAQISGTVLLDGEPLPEGEIYFVNASEGRNDMLHIKDGKFAGKATLGERKVEIRAYEEVVSEDAKAMYGADAQASRENYIPAKYNTESTLTATIEDGKTYEFEVTSRGSGTSKKSE